MNCKSHSYRPWNAICFYLMDTEKKLFFCKSHFRKFLVTIYNSRKNEKTRQKTYIASQENPQCALFCSFMQCYRQAGRNVQQVGWVNAAGSEAGLPVPGLSNRSPHPPASKKSTRSGGAFSFVRRCTFGRSRSCRRWRPDLRGGPRR